MLSWANVPDDDAGTEATLRIMRDLAMQATRDSSFVMLARRIAAPAGRDRWRQAQAIYEWVATHVRFVRDPVAYEFITSPLRLVSDIAQHGVTAEDCESMATLIAGLAEAVGLHTQFHVLSPLRPRHGRDSRFIHVWTDVLTNGEWTPLDPALPSPRFGTRPPEGETEAIFDERGTLMYVSRRAVPITRGLGQWADVASGITSGLQIAKEGINVYRAVEGRAPAFTATGQPIYMQQAPTAGVVSRYDVATATAYVTSLYRALLGREPDAGGLTAWVAAMVNQGMTPDQVRQGFINSPEYQGRVARGVASPTGAGLVAGPVVRTGTGGGLLGGGTDTMLLLIAAGFALFLLVRK